MNLATRLTYRYVPAQAEKKPGARPRVMIVLHGLGDSLNGFAFLPPALNLPDFSYLMVNAPDGYYGGYSWYEYQGNPEPGIVRSRALLLELIAEVEAQGVAAADIHLFGFSQGCLMAMDAGLRCPKVLGGICGVSGYIGLAGEYPEAFSPVAPAQRFLVTHGRRDPVVPFEPAAAQFAALQKQGIAIDFRIYDKDHTILPEELADIAAWFRALREKESA